MAPKVIRLRFEGRCARCGRVLPAATPSEWDPDRRTTTCLQCVGLVAKRAGPPPGRDRRAGAGIVGAAPVTGRPGGSAQRTYDRRRQRRDERLDQRWGHLAGLAKLALGEPGHLRSWQRGAQGERRLADELAARLGPGVAFLHDRRAPRTRSNIDHLAIAPSGVWVIDAKAYRGLVERRDRGGWFHAHERLYVNGRDRTPLVGGLRWQLEVVRTALGSIEVPVSAALCFVEAEWRLLARAFELDGVWVTRPSELSRMLAGPGPLSVIDVGHIAGHLERRLPPAVSG